MRPFDSMREMEFPPRIAAFPCALALAALVGAPGCGNEGNASGGWEEKPWCSRAEPDSIVARENIPESTPPEGLGR